MQQYLILALVLVAVQVQADEGDYFADIPNVTSVTGVAQRLSHAPASVTILDADIIEASGAQSIPELLRLVPGFQSYRVDANKWATSYQGFSADFPNRLEIRVDGRSVYLPLLSTVDWASLGVAMEDIERIEVVRGSNAATQGSNAFDGSINILTRSPLLSEGEEYRATLGTSNTRNVHFNTSGKIVGGGYRISTGYDSNDGSRRFADGAHNSYLNLSLTRALQVQDTLKLHMGITQGEIASSTNYDSERLHSQREHLSHYQSVELEHLYSGSGTFNLSLWQQLVDLNVPEASDEQIRLHIPSLSAASDDLIDSFRALNPGLRPVAEQGRSTLRDAELRLSDRWGGLALTGGLGLRYQKAESALLLQQGTVDELRPRLFANVEWRPRAKWTLNTGALFEHPDDSEQALSLRQAIGYSISDTSTVRLGWSHSERLPSLLEQHQYISFQFPGSPTSTLIDSSQLQELAPERNQTWELGYYHRLDAIDFIDIRLFHEHTRDAITSTLRAVQPEDIPSGAIAINSSVRSRINGASWNKSGFEMQLRKQLTPRLWSLLSYSYARASEVSGLADYIDRPVPRSTASLLLGWKPDDRFEINLVHEYIGAVDWLQNEQTTEQPLQLTRARIAYDWSRLDYSIETALLVEGLNNRRWSEYSQDNEYRRAAHLQLRLRYR